MIPYNNLKYFHFRLQGGSLMGDTRQLIAETINPSPPPCFHFPASSSPFGILAPSIFKGRTQEVRVASDPRLLRREEEKGQLHCVCENALLQQNRKKELQQKIDGLCKKDTIVFSSHVDPACCEDFLRSLCRDAELKHLPDLSSSSSPIIIYKENVLQQRGEKAELQQKIDVLCEKDTIVFSSHVDPACCEDFLRSLCREAELKHLPNLSSSSSPIITYKDAENCDNRDYLKGLTLASNLKDRAFFQSTSWQRSCREWEPEHQNSCCSGMQMCPSKLCQFRSLPPARVSPTIYCTEYQSNYAPKWSQSNTCMSYLHNCSPCH
ncbi:uncharacterized protein [Channa argus]|uniref:uncharacterized protein isoform X2 n=2 Tax=Channa argus TaxID=215402 RepID=UPI00351F959F